MASSASSNARPPTVLALSSQVARGHVGLSAIVPVMQRLGIQVVALPSIILSNHPGHGRATGRRIEPETILDMISTIESNGWLHEIDAVLIGYLPTAGHVRVAADTVRRIRSATREKRPVIVCDPVIGDDPKGLYIDIAAAEAIRRDLVPLADIVTPNRFEASWLAKMEVTDIASAVAAARIISPAAVVVTSVPGDARTLANVVVGKARADAAWVNRLDNVPNGTGDAFAALLLAGLLVGGNELTQAAAVATARLDVIARLSAGQQELQLIENAAAWADAAPVAMLKPLVLP